MNKVVKIIIAVVLIASFVAAMAYLIKTNNKEVDIYEKTEVFTTTISNTAVATGKLIPKEEIKIKPNISGIVSELYVEAGNKVKAGELLAKIAVVPDDGTISNVMTQLKSNQIQLKNSQMVFNRQKSLFDQGLISQQDFETAQTNYNLAKESVRASREQLEIAKTGASSSLGNGGNTLVRATVSGVVLEVPIKKGNQVIQANNFNEGTTIASIADLNKMIFEGKVEESDVSRMEMGSEIEVTVGAVQDVKLKALLDYISPQGVENNGAIQFDIRATVIPNQDFNVRAGYSANATFVLEKEEDVLAVSESVILYDDENKPYVEVEKDEGEFEKRILELGISDGINVQVLKGVKKGEQIKVWNVLKKEK